LKLSCFPGCSLDATAKEYGLSTRAACQGLGLELIEIPDWTVVEQVLVTAPITFSVMLW